MIRVLQYALHVVAVSLLSSLGVSLATALFSPGEGVFSGPEIMSFLPMTLAMVPYAVLQVVVAVLIVKPLPLLRLFALSAMLLIGITVLGVVAAQLPQGIARHVLGGLFASLSTQFNLLIPVLVLALIGRRRSAAAPPTTAGPAPTIDSESTGTPQMHVVAKAKGGWRWFYWDIALAAVPLWFGILLDPFGVLSYLGGLINVPFALIGLMMSVMLIPLVPVGLLGLLVRMLIVWPRRIRGWSGLLAAWAAVVIVCCAFVLPFVLHIPTPMDAFMAGFKKHIQWRSDVGAIQAWLDTLDTSRFADPMYYVPDTDLPSGITRLRPWSADVRLDDEDRPMVRLSWGSGMMGAWGLVVGHENMEIPPSDLSRFGEYRDPVAPGAYVWREIN